MPDEYISREAARKEIFVRVGMRTIGTRLRAAYEEAIDAIDNLPAADVAEVVQGSGKVKATEEAETTQIIDGCCTACGELMDCCEAADYKYCPYCAKRIV